MLLLMLLGEGVFPADAVLITDFVGVSSASGHQADFGVFTIVRLSRYSTAAATTT